MNSEQRPRIVQHLRGLSWRRLLAGAFSVILFGYLLVTLAANWRTLQQYEWQLNPLYLVASMGIYVVSLLLGAFTWHLTVWSMDQTVPYRQATKFYLKSNVAKRLPGLVWYALSRLYLYEREGVAKSVITIALALEMVSLIAGGVVAYVVTLWGNATSIAAIRQWWVILPVAGLAAVVIHPQSLYALVNWILVKRGHPAIHEQAKRGDLVKLILLQLGGWMTGGLFIYFLAVGIYSDLGWSQLVGVVNGWVGAGLVAYVTLIVPLGLGLKEVTLAYLLSAFVPWPIAVLISLVGRICSIIGDCVGLLLASRL